MLSPTFLAVLLAAMPSVYAIDKNWWPQVDCYVGNVMIDNHYVDHDRSLKYDWQLTYQTCINNFAPQVARYDHGSGRVRYPLISETKLTYFVQCVAINTDVGIDGEKWWKDCKTQAQDGWYDVDPKTNNIVINHNAYTSTLAEGRGYGY
ncbi:hypothetical protein BFJ66_g17856 [Fusarium oxysporum f. sp. cepae]|uniref:Uncharacterized protein n=1 Tax=Fusarium oxysporum f. sp. cepae TaxID=396571 RepID=A0A3L6MNE4_FUSOX|nr:hypothetical protein BFJ65_g18619 [Fusarium oxysporum f. sp. cepae]RKK19056.1 hypothetical protein BFJ66_g17856 [Fusarium oxysporum f. sp. cepae]RKK19115.1 hypothetical protein BFJ67_g17586 [Fusarium oxysporum f. sp. cepae]